MKRDLAVSALAMLLLAPALSVAGLASGRLLPSTPSGYYPVALGVCVLFFLGVAPVRGSAWWRPLTLALAAAPFLVFAMVESGAGLPGPGWFAVLGVGMLIGLTGRNASSLAAALVVLLGGGAVLAAGDLGVVPRTFDPLAAPRVDETPAGNSGTTSRQGAPLVRERGDVALGAGPGPWWGAGSAATLPPRPVLRMIDGDSEMAQPQTRVTISAAAGEPFTHPFDLAGIDAVFVGADAWAADDAHANEKAGALVGFVRSGGLLIGPGPHDGWPPRLGMRLRDAGRVEDSGPDAARALGLGRVARAADVRDLEAVLEARLWVPEIATVFDRRSGGLPRVPEAFTPWHDRPHERRVQGILLIVYSLAVAAFAWLVRAPFALLLVVLLAASVACVGILWTSPEDPGFRIHGFALDLGGAGGRRIEGLVVSAGPQGFRRVVQWRGGGSLILRGARLAGGGTVAVPPGRTGWILRERVGVGIAAGDVEERGSLFVQSLLVGEVDLRRVRLGRLPALPVGISGHGPVPAATLQYRPASP